MSPFTMPATVNAIDSGAVLNFTRLAGDTVRVTRAYFDPFDATYDHEVLEGDFLIEDLRAALVAVSAPVTGAVPVQRKRWWQRG